jgi:hypothetical protein
MTIGPNPLHFSDLATCDIFVLKLKLVLKEKRFDDVTTIKGNFAYLKTWDFHTCFQ